MSSPSRRDRAKAAIELIQATDSETTTTQESSVQPATSSPLTTDLIAGFLVALVAVPMCLSSSALIYSGDLSPLIPVGVAGAFLGCAIVAAITSSMSSMPFAIGTVALEIGIILAYIAGHVAKIMGDSPKTFSTVWVAVLVGTFVTGLILLLIGRMGIGRWIRFMPYPVIAGFLAGMGALAYAGAFRVMSGVDLSWSTVPELFLWENIVLWSPGVLFAVSLIAIRSQTNHHLVMPLLVSGWFLLFNVACGIATLLSFDVPDGYFFRSVSPAGFLGFVQEFRFSNVEWGILLDQFPLFTAMAVLAASSILLYCSTLEVAWGADCDPNRELRVSGIACLASSLLGGMAGHLSLGMSMLSYEAHGRGRSVGLMTAACVLMILLVGTPLIAFYPKPIIGGLLISFGLVMIIEYLVITATRLPWLEWSVIAIITAVITFVGLLEGVVAGLVLSCIQFAIACSQQRVIRRELDGRTEQSRVQRELPQKMILQQQGQSIKILELQGFLFFGVATVLLEHVKKIADASDDSKQYIIFDFSMVNGIDSSVTNCFTRMKQVAEQHNMQLIFANITSNTLQQFEAAKMLSKEGTLQVKFNLDEALEWCENQILQKRVVRRARVMPIGILLGQFGMEQEVTQKLVAHLERVTAKAGESIHEEHQKMDSAYFVESGRLFELETEDSQRERIRTLGPGSVFHKAALFQPYTSHTRLVAEQPTVLYRLSQQKLDKLRTEAPEVIPALLDFFIQRFAEDKLSNSQASLTE